MPKCGQISLNFSQNFVPSDNLAWAGGGNFFRPERACQPASYEEASQRPIYTVLNQRKVDVGNPMFGVRTPGPLLGWLLCLCSCAQDQEECLRVCV